MSITNALMLAGITATGLMAGLFYGWSASVIPGLKRVDDTGYVTTMQQVNRAIINPGFLLPFVGIPVLLVGAAAAQVRVGDARRGALLASAAATYLVGVLGVTGTRNVPLNDELAAFRLIDASDEAIERRRRRYESRWNRWHAVRTTANLAAFVLAASASVVAADPT